MFLCIDLLIYLYTHIESSSLINPFICSVISLMYLFTFHHLTSPFIHLFIHPSIYLLLITSSLIHPFTYHHLTSPIITSHHLSSSLITSHHLKSPHITYHHLSSPHITYHLYRTADYMGNTFIRTILHTRLYCASA